jgi:asparagine synthase (glutamine-hydrolysing)
MCGIVGIVSQSTTVDKALLEQMISIIVHRGPNHSAARVEHQPRLSVGLGYCRLSIIDLSPAGNQPMSNEEGDTWIVYNGELYNHADLRRELEAKGHRYRSFTDTETILHAYEAWGTDAFARFNGMFAFALYDQKSSSLFLARDRRAIKPLYYRWDGHSLVFASELKALLKAGVVRADVDPTALWLFLCMGYVPSPHSILAGVHKLEPGYFLELRDGKMRLERFAPPDRQAAGVYDEHEAASLVRESLEQAVRRQLMSDVPIGVFLSGGLDSTIVASLASRHMASPLHTFSIGYAGAPGAEEIDSRYTDDFYFARQIAESLGSVHHEIVIENNSTLTDLFVRLVFQLDEPMVEPAFMSTHYLSKLARESGVPVILTGDGADELFGGYDRYFAAQRLAMYKKIPGLRWTLPVIETVGGPLQIARNAGELKYLLDNPAVTESYIRFSSIYRPDQALTLLAPDVRTRVDTHALNRLVEAALGAPGAFVDQMAHADLVLWVGEHFNPRLDRISMLHSVEARVPFQDDVVVDAALSIPTDRKSTNGSRKRLLKQAFADIVPDLALTRPKRSYQAPGAAWLRGGLNEIYRQLVEGDGVLTELFDPAQIRQYSRARDVGSIQNVPGGVFAVSALLIAGLWAWQCLGDDNRMRACNNGRS